MQHICTETHELDLTNKIAAKLAGETSHNRSDRHHSRSDRPLAGRTAAQLGLSQISSLKSETSLEISNE